MGYIDQNLTKNEEIIKTAKLHWFIYVRGGLVLLLGLIYSLPQETQGMGSFLITLGLTLLVLAFISVKTTELAVTSKRVIAKYGLISRQTIELNLNKIEGLDVNQGIFGRIFNYGNIIVGGVGGKKSPIKYISNPLEFRKEVNEQTEV